MSETRTSAEADSKIWFTPSKKDALYLVGCKRRNILGTASGKNNSKRHKMPFSNQQIKAEVINKGLYNGKIYFQHDNAKPHIAKIVKKIEA